CCLQLVSNSDGQSESATKRTVMFDRMLFVAMLTSVAWSALAVSGQPEKTFERTERFERDPGWEAHNNTLAPPPPTRQDFGFSDTSNAGGKPGELGGFITPAA